MDRAEIIEGLKKYFDIRELACPHVFKKYGNRSWKFLDTNALWTLLILRRDILKVPLVINDYHLGLGHTQRGNRCNLCAIVKKKTESRTLYLSGHVYGKAFDLVPVGMTATKARNIIINNSPLLPVPVRLESDTAAPTWVHFDVMYDEDDNKVTVFEP